MIWFNDMIDMIWYDRYDMIWFNDMIDMIWYDWYDMIWYDRYDMIWFNDMIDMIWYDALGQICGGALQIEERSRSGCCMAPLLGLY